MASASASASASEPIWHALAAEPDALGESPFWHPDEQRLYWVDISGQQVRRARPGEPVESWSLPQEPGCIAPARRGGLVLALRDGIYRARAWQAELVLIERAPHDGATMRFNDGKADGLGRFWAGSIYEPKTQPLAQLHSFDCRPAVVSGGRPQVQRQAEGASTANGLAWSPDGATLYWADTPRHTIWAWDWDAPSNRMGEQRVFAQFPAKPPGWQAGDPGYGGRPDGAAVDEEGHYWCAMYEGGRVLRIAPDGRIVQALRTPMTCPTMPCFGGEDRRTLYVTSASHGRPAAELAQQPLAGRVIGTRVAVAGLTVNFFID
jgi:sugar lactone lactonase YvrE